MVKGLGTFLEGPWGKTHDPGQHGQEGPEAGALRLPALQDGEDALVHTSDLFSPVALQIKHKALTRPMCHSDTLLHKSAGSFLRNTYPCSWCHP